MFPAAQGEVRVRIASPTEDAYLAGPVRLVAIVEPAPAAKQVTEVLFFADGRQVCALSQAPFECEWDAGERVTAHQIRVAVTLRTAAGSSIPSGRGSSSTPNRWTWTSSRSRRS